MGVVKRDDALEGNQTICQQDKFRESQEVAERQQETSILSNDGLQVQPLLHNRASDWRAPTIVLAFKCLESIAYFGVLNNMVVYLTTILKESNSDAAAHVAVWNGTCFLTTLLGAFVNDSLLGSFNSTFVFALLYSIGLLTVTLSVFLTSAGTRSSGLYYVGLYLIAIGSGGEKSSMLPLGAQQFEDDGPREQAAKANFFSYYYVLVSVGQMIAGATIIWVQEKISWVIGYVASALCFAAGFAAFLLGSRLFKRLPPGGGPWKSVVQVIVASIRKARLKAPVDGNCLLHGDVGVKRSTPPYLSFLDKAAMADSIDQLNSGAINPWRLCSVRQVEKVKMLVNLLPSWVTGALYCISALQINTTVVEQGKAMNTSIFSISIPPALLTSTVVSISMASCVVLHKKLISPLARRFTHHPRGLSLFQCMGLGRVIMILAMATAALTEHARLQGLQTNGERISIAWQLPTIFLIGASETMSLIAQLEFFYEESPDGMKGMGSALFFTSIAAGSYFNSILILLVQMVTSGGSDSKGWISNDLDHGHLDYFYWLLAGICSFNFVAELIVFRNFSINKSKIVS